MTTNYPEGHVGGMPNLSPRDWQLYSDMKGVNAAAKDLNKALFQAKLYLQDMLPHVHKKPAINGYVSNAYTRYMVKVMDLHRQFGATDTEPRQKVQQELSDAARKVLGMDEDELDFYDLW